jgi:hypothetical protein
MFSLKEKLELVSPPVSIILNVLLSQIASPYILSLVTPGSSSTIAILLFRNLLKIVDLPTFGLPISARSSAS